MKIGIIGTGNIGGALTRRLRMLGHDVKIANSRGPESLAGLAQETGAKPVTVEEAVRNRDVIVVTIPEKNIPHLPQNLFKDVPKETVVVDTGNYYPNQRDGRIEEIEAGLPESQWVEKKLGRPVIKAFNNIYAKHLHDLGGPRGPRIESRCPWPVTIRRPRRWFSAWSMNWASTQSTRAG